MGASKSILHLIHYRNKNRIRDFGEVFTSEKYVNQILDRLDKSVWTDTNTIFYEPTCGHGNFVSAIVKRRLKIFLKKAKSQNRNKPHFYAVANTLNNLWATDIDSKNIKLCRERVRTLVFNFLSENATSSNLFMTKNRDFLTHVLCCIGWQIHENEALSCLETDLIKAQNMANKTAISKKWLKKNRHRPINFEMNWLEHFKNCEKDKKIPFEYTKNFKFISSLIEGKRKNYRKTESIKSFSRKDFFNHRLRLVA